MKITISGDEVEFNQTFLENLTDAELINFFRDCDSPLIRHFCDRLDRANDNDAYGYGKFNRGR